MTTIVSASRPSELLLALPRMLGYQPVESILIQTFRAKRTEASLRIDIPGPGPAARDRAVADHLLRLVSRVPGIEAILIVFYSTGAACSPRPPHARLAKRLTRAFGSAGLKVLDTLWVDGDHWASYLDSEKGTLSQLTGGVMDAQLIASGLTDEPPTRTSVDIPLRDVATRSRILKTGRGFGAAAAGLATASPEAESAVLAEWSECLGRDPDDLDDETIARLLLSLTDELTRDAVLMDMAWGADAARIVWHYGAYPGDDETGFLRAEKAFHRISGRYLGLDGTPPSGLRMECAERLLRHLAGFAPEPWRVAPLALLGWLAWARGRGSDAGEYLDAALTIAPQCRVARVTMSVLEQGGIPDWVGRQPI